jgi:hypothetical protein
MICKYVYDAAPGSGYVDSERSETYYGQSAIWKYDASITEILAKWIEAETILTASDAWEVATLLNKTDIDEDWVRENINQEYMNELAEEDYRRNN